MLHLINTVSTVLRGTKERTRVRERASLSQCSQPITDRQGIHIHTRGRRRRGAGGRRLVHFHPIPLLLYYPLLLPKLSNVAQILLYGRTRGSCSCTRRCPAGSVRSPMRARSSRSRTPREPRNGGWCPCGFGRPVMPRYAVGTARRRLVRVRRTYTGSA